MKQIIIILVILFILSCKTQQVELNNDSNIECFLIEETFDNNQMKVFLSTTTNDKEIINKFLSDTHEYSYLTLKGDKIKYMYSENGTDWQIESIEENFSSKNPIILNCIEDLIKQNTVFKSDFNKNISITDSDIDFQSIWVKSKGNLKFLYYSTRCGFPYLNQSSKNKLEKLIELESFMASTF